jgi:CRAL/TRIO domain/CRAL/TRIO, N-terminal domain
MSSSSSSSSESSEIRELNGQKVYRLIWLDDEQRQCLASMKEAVAKSDDEHAERAASDDYTLHRYLVARQFDVAKASELLLATLVWRREQKPERMLEDGVAESLVENKRRKSVWWRHRDVYGRPVMLGFGERHLAAFPTLQEKVDHALWCLESGIQRATEQDGVASQFVVLADIANLGMKNIELEFFKIMIDVLQNHYVERLGGFYITNAGFIFSTVWRVVRSWLDARSVAKIFISPKQEVLNALFDSVDKLPKSFGGRADDAELIEPDDDAPSS